MPKYPGSSFPHTADSSMLSSLAETEEPSDLNVSRILLVIKTEAVSGPKREFMIFV